MVHMAKMAQTEAILAYISTEKKINEKQKENHSNRFEGRALPQLA